MFDLALIFYTAALQNYLKTVETHATNLAVTAD